MTLTPHIESSLQNKLQFLQIFSILRSMPYDRNLHPKLCYIRRMQLWEVLVPTNMGDTGKTVRTRHHQVWDARVLALSGGLTILKPAKGQWVCPSDGKLYHDRVIPVRIACDRKTIVKILQITKAHYRQIDVLAYKISEEVIFLSAEEKP